MLPHHYNETRKLSAAPLTRQSVLLVAAMAGGNCFADWTGGVEAGGRLGSTSAPALRFYASNRAEPLSHYAYVDWIRYSDNNSYKVGYNPTFKISESVYSFGRFSLEGDEPGAVDREADAQVGIGNNLFRRGSTQVKIEAGVGAAYVTFDDDTDNTEDGFGFLTSSMSTGVLPLVRLDAILGARAGTEQTLLDAEVGLSIPVGPSTALRYAYIVTRRNLDDGDDTTEEGSFVKLVYGF